MREGPADRREDRREGRGRDWDDYPRARPYPYPYRDRDDYRGDRDRYDYNRGPWAEGRARVQYYNQANLRHKAHELDEARRYGGDRAYAVNRRNNARQQVENVHDREEYAEHYGEGIPPLRAYDHDYDRDDYRAQPYPYRGGRGDYYRSMRYGDGDRDWDDRRRGGEEHERW
jgi:hypothetical protein